jgi:hypothetical protein
MVLGAETPIDVWKDGLALEVYCTEDAAAYFESPLPMLRSREKTGLSAFSTFLGKKHGKGYCYQAISLFPACCFCFDHEKKSTLEP